ncbi:energy-coupling factor transporter transmembrane component T [Bacteriovorax sp. PP10]|uniref:Energy-coupling factor transporter transmembrane component T n=1 Tax=Bacteriovorax antarcticus TaxID=3088717 RepID=A0ABU5VR35_9BACT|nr:energy-coupling factor transporter transmembrane component T [Bacteriovorax sp. PP10]MEA9355377.1 energy-coupling factor transporter transmembrane component T [Bacteriovorax sp. PP10]
MKFLETKKEFIHSWYLLIMSMFGLVFLLASKTLPLNFLMVGFLLYLYIKNGLPTRVLIKLALFALIFSSVFLFLNLLYPGEKLRVGEQLYVGHFTFYKAALMNGLINFSRLFMLSLVSMCSTYAIIYTKVILYLIIHKGLKVIMGYPLLIALNSILLFKEEFDRIRLSARFRGLGWWDRLFVLFPLLVFAIRHSQRGSLSLVTRGLNPNKSFYFGYDIVPSDRKWLRSFFLMFICMVAIAIYFR